MKFSEYLDKGFYGDIDDVSDTTVPNITATPEKPAPAKCGADCSDCDFFLGGSCGGCTASSDEDGCDIYDCCAAKEHDNCGLCPDFPCDLLRDASFDEEDGDDGDRLVRLKNAADRTENRASSMRSWLASGLLTGLALGIVMGCLSSSLGSWLLGGTVLGTGIGAIIGTVRNDR